MPNAAGLLLDGRYRVGEVIGSGGMSVVHEGEDLRLGRRVAIKMLDDAASGHSAERLFREARAAARANHPAIVTVFGYGTDDTTGLNYLVMERLQGEDLGARIAREKALDIAFVRRLGCEVADALAAAHAAGVTHRDLKPTNVFLARRGLRVDEIKLLDFGVAKQADMHSLTAEGEVIGTLCYMAPEQLRASKRADARSDVYALGVVLYECLTGARPYRARSVTELLVETLAHAVPPVTQIRPDVPAVFADVISRCVEKRPDRRFPSARSLCDALLALD